MPLSNTTLDTLSGQPYWDDYDRTKRYHRVLIQPKRAVQSRELNQMQSILQNQVEQFGTGVYKEGDAVTGGNITFANNVQALQLVRDNDIVIGNFYNNSTGYGATVTGQTSLAEGRIVQVSTQPGEEYAAVVIVPTNSYTFQAGESVEFTDPDNQSVLASMVVAPEPLRPAAIFSVDTGVYFLRGHFLDVAKQTIVLSTSNTNVSMRVGFAVNEVIVTESTDTSLKDPALNTTNYAAPGAHRLQLTAELTSRPIDGLDTITDNADENFIELQRIINGTILTPTEKLNPTFIEDVIARRTYDESGNYVVKPFTLRVTEHNPDAFIPNGTGRILGNTSSSVIVCADLLSNATLTAFSSEVSVGDVLVVNGERRTVTAVTNNTQLTVNAAFNANFSNADFIVVSDNMLTYELDPGKAYVYGYEFETLGTTKLHAPRPRTTNSFANIDIGTYFGPYVLVNRANAVFNIETTPAVDLHSVPFELVNTVANTYATTQIGTARLRSMVYYSGNGNLTSTIYKAYLINGQFNTKTLGIASNGAANHINSMSVELSNSMITLTHDFTGAASLLPRSNTAYNQSVLLLGAKDGGTLRYLVENTEVTTATATTTVVRLKVNAAKAGAASNAFLDLVNTTSNLSFSFSDACIRGFTPNISKLSGATVSIVGGRDGDAEVGRTLVYGTEDTSLLFKMPESWVKANTITNEDYEIVRYFPTVSSSSVNGSNTRFTITVSSSNPSEAFYPTSLSEPFKSIEVSNSTSGFVPVTSSQVIYTPSTTSATIEIPTSLVGSGAINVLARVAVNAPGTANPRIKTLVTANTSTGSITFVGDDPSTDLAKGHIAITTINAASNPIVSLGVPDVYALQKVYAVNATARVDVTSRYDLDNGQRDWCYDYASLVLKPGYQHHPSLTRLVAMVDYFTHSSANGYFVADSYTDTIDYADIPVFIDPSTKRAVALRDCIDFRPVRTANTSSAASANNPYSNSAAAVFASQNIPYPDATFELDYEYYLGRVDKIVLTNAKELRVLEGTPGRLPAPPADIPDSITLFVIYHYPYTADPKLSRTERLDYRRYTMKDIGRLEKRIENLEYYVQLSFLEQQALNTAEFDGEFERYKNGIFVDPFANYSIGDMNHEDWSAAINTYTKEMGPQEIPHVVGMGQYDAGNSSNMTYHANSGMVTLSYTTDTFITQPLASKTVNINPFGVAAWFGSVTLVPSTDIFFSTVRVPSEPIPLFDPTDPKNKNGYTDTLGSIGGAIQYNWTGATYGNIHTTEFLQQDYGDDNWRLRYMEKTTATATVSGKQQITDVKSTITISNPIDLGDRIVDTQIATQMRRADIGVKATGLKPGTEVRAFFDGTDVTRFTDRANKIQLTSNTVAARFIASERVQGFYANGTATGFYGKLLGVSGDTLHVVDCVGDLANTAVIKDPDEDTLNREGTVSGKEIHSGRLATTSSGTNQVVLGVGAPTVNSAVEGQVLYITSTGSVDAEVTQDDQLRLPYAAGWFSKVTAYDSATRTATLEFNLPTNSGSVIYPSSGSTYSIGPLVAENTVAAAIAEFDDTTGYPTPTAASVNPGRFYGLFRLPGNVFGTGRRMFSLSNKGTTSGALTESSGFFESSGYTRKVQNLSVTTRNVGISLPTRTVTGTYQTQVASIDATDRYYDPLAQTFMVDPSVYANGVYISGVDLFFGRVDGDKVPVTVEIRNTVNGYPASTGYLPGSRVEKTSTDINVVPSGVTPDTSNTSHVTSFTFDNPIYLAPGLEYALVIMTNSFNYELLTAEVGQKLIGSDKIIAEQPYGGSFFKSQNAKTWTAEQNEDLMFVLNRAVFSTDAGTATFTMSRAVDASASSYVSNGAFEFDSVVVEPEPMDHAATRATDTYLLRLTNSANNLSDFVVTPIETVVDLTEAKRLRTSNTTCASLRFTTQTPVDVVSTMLDASRVKFVATKKVIDNGDLYSEGFVITNPGSGFATGNVTLTLADGYGSGATANAVVNAAGMIESIVVGTSGSGYIESPTVTWSASCTTNAVISYRGETSAKQNISTEQKARYISKTVQLASGFDASDIKVYFSAVRPQGTNIDVYYKVLGTGDNTTFDNRNWVRMRLVDADANKYSRTKKQFLEYQYKTANNTAAYTTSDGTVIDRFHTFAVKVVMRTDSKQQIPRLKNLRVIALDE